LLHYQRIDELPWVRTYGAAARLVIPHIVMDEIDSKSYETGSNVHKRARGIYGMLEGMLDQMDADGITIVQDGTPCMFLLDDPGHRRLGNNDDEIVSRAGYLQQYLKPGTVAVLTSDIGMRGRALAWRLKAEKLPDNFKRSVTRPSSAEIKVALSELE
jgi:predicted ribonuclease YlaK